MYASENRSMESGSIGYASALYFRIKSAAEITSQENHIREMELQQSHLAETLELTSSQNTKKEKNAQKKVQEAQQALDDAGDVTAEEKKRLEEALSNAQQELETLEAKTRSDERGIQEQLTSLKEQLEVQRGKTYDSEDNTVFIQGDHDGDSGDHKQCNAGNVQNLLVTGFFM